MENSFVYSSVRKSSRTLFYLCLAGIVILFALLAINWRYLYNLVRGPFAISTAELVEITDPAQRTEYFVTFKADDVAETGYQRITTYDDGTQKIDASFPVTLIGQNILLIETDQTELDLDFTGALKPLSEEVKTNVLDRLITDVPELTDFFLPYMLVENNFRLNGIIGLSAGLFIFFGLVVGCLIAIRRIGDPSQHQSIKDIERFGPVEETINQIDAELDAEHVAIGDAHLTENWLVLVPSGSVDATRFHDIVWIFKQVTQNRTIGIPTHKSYSVVINDRFGEQLTFTTAESRADELLDALAERCPWAELGHSDEREAQWNSDRETLIAMVAERLASGNYPEPAHEPGTTGQGAADPEIQA